MHLEGGHCCNWESAALRAAENGRLHVLEWLRANGYGYAVSVTRCRRAIRRTVDDVAVGRIADDPPWQGLQAHASVVDSARIHARRERVAAWLDVIEDLHELPGAFV